jgi:hypothetical protein
MANLQNAEIVDQTSFNLLCMREKAHSIMNLNFTVKHIPQPDMEQRVSEESGSEEAVSIEEQMSGE